MRGAARIAVIVLWGLMRRRRAARVQPGMPAIHVVSRHVRSCSATVTQRVLLGHIRIAHATAPINGQAQRVTIALNDSARLPIAGRVQQDIKVTPFVSLAARKQRTAVGMPSPCQAILLAATARVSTSGRARTAAIVQMPSTPR